MSVPLLPPNPPPPEEECSLCLGGPNGLDGGENMFITGWNMVLNPLFMLLKKPLKPLLKNWASTTPTARMAAAAAKYGINLITSLSGDD